MACSWKLQPIHLIALILLAIAIVYLCLSLLWISQLHFALQTCYGIVVGLAAALSFFVMQVERSYYNRRKGIAIAQLSLADAATLQRLLFTGLAPSWLPLAADPEQVRWLNVGLCKVWPYFKEAYTGMLQVELQAALKRYKPEAIRDLWIGKINLGKCSPFIQGIKAVGSAGETALEVQLDWRQNEDQEMILHVFTFGPEYTIQVRHFVIYAEFKLTFTPLKPEFPGFAAVVVSISEPPLVDFQTKILNGDVKAMPEMEKAVDRILLGALMDTLVWPNRAVLPIIPGEYSYLKASCAGHLHVWLLVANELANKELTGTSNPYVVFFIRWKQDLMKESRRIYDTSEPEWNESFIFDIEDPTAQKLTIKMMNSDDSNLDQYIGTIELPIGELEANVKKEIWVELYGDPVKLHGRCAGKVQLVVEYKPLNSVCMECDAADEQNHVWQPIFTTDAADTLPEDNVSAADTEIDNEVPKAIMSNNAHELLNSIDRSADVLLLIQGSQNMECDTLDAQKRVWQPIFPGANSTDPADNLPEDNISAADADIDNEVPKAMVSNDAHGLLDSVDKSADVSLPIQGSQNLQHLGALDAENSGGTSDESTKVMDYKRKCGSVVDTVDELNSQVVRLGGEGDGNNDTDAGSIGYELHPEILASDMLKPLVNRKDLSLERDDVQMILNNGEVNSNETCIPHVFTQEMLESELFEVD